MKRVKDQPGQSNSQNDCSPEKDQPWTIETQAKIDGADNQWVATCIKMELDYIKTPGDFVQLLYEFDNPICKLFARMLEEPQRKPEMIYDGPKGEIIYKGVLQLYGGWKLILKRCNRGSPKKTNSDRQIAWLWDGEVREHGERNAIKRVAQQLHMSPAAIRSAIRRAAGTHSKRRKPRGRE